MAEDKKVDFEKLRKGFGVVLERRKLYFILVS